MGDRYRTGDGWTVEVVRLVLTPDKHDGEWMRVNYRGWHVADVRDVAELVRWFDLGGLEPDGLTRPGPYRPPCITGQLRQAVGSPATPRRQASLGVRSPTRTIGTS
jgi:hypothetical protein